MDADQFEDAPGIGLVPVNVTAALLIGNRFAAKILADNLGGLVGMPGYLFIRALEHPGEDHSEGLRKLDAWATENDVDLSTYPEILAAFGAYDRVANPLNTDTWIWLPTYKHFRQSPEFRTLMHNNGFLEYWQSKGFPPQ